MSTKLLDHLVSVGNKSGAIPSAPGSLKTLKQAIEAVPFDTNSPGMSQVLQMSNLVAGLVQAIKELGSLAAVGEFKNILGRVQQELAGQALSSVDPERLTAALQRAVSTDELREAVGDAAALGVSLRNYVG